MKARTLDEAGRRLPTELSRQSVSSTQPVYLSVRVPLPQSVNRRPCEDPGHTYSCAAARVTSDRLNSQRAFYFGFSFWLHLRELSKVNCGTSSFRIAKMQRFSRNAICQN